MHPVPKLRLCISTYQYQHTICRYNTDMLFRESGRIGKK